MAQEGDKVIAKKDGVKVYATPDANNEVSFASGSPSVPVYTIDEKIGTFIRSQSYSRFVWFKVKAIRKYKALIITKTDRLIPIITYEDRTAEFEGWVRNTDVVVIAAIMPDPIPDPIPDPVPDTESGNGGSESGNEPNSGNGSKAPKATSASGQTSTTTTKTLTTLMYVAIGILVSIAVKIIFFPTVKKQNNVSTK